MLRNLQKLNKNIGNLSSLASKPKTRNSNKMMAWKLDSYGDLSELNLAPTRIPIIQDPDDVLIEIKAASVNPIDLLMMGGYGRTIFQIPRNYEIEFPLILGRDFCGTIIAKGAGISNYKVGDEVYGFFPLHKQGGFAQYAVTNQHYMLPKPNNLSPDDSVSLVYSTMTAWSALFLFGNMLRTQNKGLKVLVLGASGGVGVSAIQLLKSQGCTVFATCSTDAIELVQSLGADVVFDYKDKDYLKNIASEGKYHIILDSAKFGIENVPSDWNFDSYITLNSPLLINTDNLGLVGGLFKSAENLCRANLTNIGKGRLVKWGFFTPSNSGFKFIDKLIQNGSIRPVIHKRFSFEELPVAMKTLAEGHMRGKIVVNY